MSKNSKIRWGWIKGMYIYTIVVAGMLGVGMLAVPEMIRSMFRWPADEPVSFGILGSTYAAFGLLAILGLRSPLKFVPFLLMQLFYKLIWFIAVLLPLVVTGHFPVYGITFIIVFLTFIIGDLIAIPFSSVFVKE